MNKKQLFQTLMIKYPKNYNELDEFLRGEEAKEIKKAKKIKKK